MADKILPENQIVGPLWKLKIAKNYFLYHFQPLWVKIMRNLVEKRMKIH
jgi:hypothetical protein